MVKQKIDTSLKIQIIQRMMERRYTYDEIGEILDMSKQAVMYYIRKFSLQRSKRKIKNK